MKQLVLICTINSMNFQAYHTGETWGNKECGIKNAGAQYIATKKNLESECIWQNTITNAGEIAHGKSKGNRLMRDACHSEATATNRHIDLHPAYQALRSAMTKYKKQPLTIPNSLRTCKAHPDNDPNDGHVRG